MSATVSLIDPTTLNPSSSGPENSRLARPPVFLTRADQQTSVDQLEVLLTEAKAYRLQMLALSKAAANFGYALEKIAHSKAAIRDSSNICMTYSLPPPKKSLSRCCLSTNDRLSQRHQHSLESTSGCRTSLHDVKPSPDPGKRLTGTHLVKAWD